MRGKARRGGGRQVEVTIERLGARGDGVASLEGRPFFVEGALPGERVLARVVSPKSGGYRGEVVELREAAPERAEPPCPHYGPCGGCSVQHLEAEAYRRWKAGLVTAALARHGLEAARSAPMAEVPERSRRRAVLAAKKSARGVDLGFRAFRSHAIVDLHACLVLRPALFNLLAPLRAALDDCLTPGESLTIALLDSETGIDMTLEAPEFPALSVTEALAAFAGDRDLARVSWRPAGEAPLPIVQRRPATLCFAETAVEPPPGGFVQATAEGEAALAEALRDFLAGDPPGSVADLYAGCGALSFQLAALGAKVRAYEGDGEALEALNRAANARPGIGVVGERRDLARSPLRDADLAPFDAVVFDPPRAGAKEQAEALAASPVPRVIAMSCNPGSFARDARILVDGGYRLEEVRPVDQFLWTGHLELAALFSRA